MESLPIGKGRSGSGPRRAVLNLWVVLGQTSWPFTSAATAVLPTWPRPPGLTWAAHRGLEGPAGQGHSLIGVEDFPDAALAALAPKALRQKPGFKQIDHSHATRGSTRLRFLSRAATSQNRAVGKSLRRSRFEGAHGPDMHKRLVHGPRCPGSPRVQVEFCLQSTSRSMLRSPRGHHASE